MPNPSISSAEGIEIKGTVVEVWESSGEGECGVLVRGGVIAVSILVGGGVGD